MFFSGFGNWINYISDYSQTTLIRIYFYPEFCYSDKIPYSLSFCNTYTCISLKKYTVIRKFVTRNLVLIRNKFNIILNFFHIYSCVFYTLNRTKVYAQILYLRIRSEKNLLLVDITAGHNIKKETKAKLTNVHVHLRCIRNKVTFFNLFKKS